LAMLIYSIVAVCAGALLPRLAHRDAQLLGEDGDEEETELERLRQVVRQWEVEATHKGQHLRLPRMPLFLRDIWMGALFLFSIITFSTFFISTVWQAIIAVSLVGICWAVACWVPFAIIMEFLKEVDQKSVARHHGHDANIESNYTPAYSSEGDPLLPIEGEPIAGGTILGVHNLAIVMPQFIVALVSSAIFRAVDAEPEAAEPGGQTSYYGKNGVAWVLRFGGMCALLGAIMCQVLPLTRAEREMRRRLHLMREIAAYPS